MATRSTISLKINESDKGKKFKFDENKLPEGVGYEKDYIDLLSSIMIETDYLTIYHHWDGYPDGVGATLLDEFNDYDSILNLMLGGDASTINGNTIVQYTAWRGETGCEARQSNAEPSVTEEYAYLFKDGKWYFKDDCEINKWTDLEEYLAKFGGE